jgi:hypothetical protein
VPRIVIFNPDLSLKTPTVTKLWNNKLMIRTLPPLAPAKPQNPDDTQPIPQPMEVFFQDVGDINGQTQKVVPTVANLVFLLGHRPSQENETPGFDLPYSRVVSALTQLCRSGDIESAGQACEVEVRRNSLAEAVAVSRLETGTKIRAETNNPSPPPETAPAPAPVPPRPEK